MKILEVEKMNKTERLQAMEELWDSFLREENELDSPQWHQDILEKRNFICDLRGENIDRINKNYRILKLQSILINPVHPVNPVA
ncbi:addiction module protein [Geoalkalibacter subterraneus]|uniref:Addiction module component CHP02574 family protein n=1 Tax=Geoalkalibacter subterraneus TaxID=483547 RepID=A0A0B5FPC8_9BACT|nr:addiction module protein [Geoalkalibacter subterraneus]AJF06499.1 hypothetical protein GSUB_08000 [Geoalkalibacter subterraneus]